MPAIDFPAAPAVNDEYSFEGRTWRWNGTGWEVKEYPAALLAGTAANPSLYFSGDPNTGLYSPGADQVALSTGGTGRLFIDSSGRLLVGTSTARTNFSYAFGTAPTRFQVEDTNTGVPTISAIQNYDSTTLGAPAYLVLARSGASTLGSNTVVANNNYLGEIDFSGADGTNIIRAAFIRGEVDGTPGANDMPGRLVFATTADGAATPTEAMRINNQRELLIGTITRTANGGVLQISNGITFPGTQSACSDPNTLDDYEEGTFTPTIVGTGTAGSGTYSVNEGTYTKIGNAVVVRLQIIWSNHTGTGDMRISGLPFTILGTHAGSALPQNVLLTAGNVLYIYFEGNTTQVVLYQGPTGGGAISAVPIDTAGDLIVTCTYRV